MMTPFVAYPPNILVVRGRDALVELCRSAGRSIGMPVRAAADAETALSLAHETRPLVFVCDASAGAEAASVAASLATAIDAAVLQADLHETTEALAARLLEACVIVEKRRGSAR